jgi:preprotein translocase subunit SecE
MKRQMQRQGQTGPDGAPAPSQKRQPQPRTAPANRTKPMQFLREVRIELKKVAWPTRTEVLNYSTVVLVTLILLIGLILGLDYMFSKSVLFLFKA